MRLLGCIGAGIGIIISLGIILLMLLYVFAVFAPTEGVLVAIGMVLLVLATGLLWGDNLHKLGIFP